MAAITTRIAKLFFSYDWEVIELQGAVFKITWGLWLLMPFRSFRMIEGYNSVGNENYWGLALAVLGLIHFLAMISNRIKIRRTITMFAFLFWVFTVVLIARQLATSTLIPMFSVIAFFMGINFMRLGVAEKLSQRVIDKGRPGGLPDRRVT